MSGKLLGIFIILGSIAGGLVMYWLQLYAYYEELPNNTEIELVNLVTNDAEIIMVSEMVGINATSSPLRFRACFTTPHSQAMLTETYVLYEDATPLVAPSWFDCFDAVEIGTDIEQGIAIAFIGKKNIQSGVDRVVAVYPNGQAYAWHQLNEQFAE